MFDVKKVTRDLLKESMISPSFYDPINNPYFEKCVAITINNKPFLLLGAANDQEAHDIADRLLKCSKFMEVVEYQFGNVILQKIEASNVKLPRHRLMGIHTCKQGELSIAEGPTAEPVNLKAIFIAAPYSISSFVLHCCIQDSIMKCFHPEAKTLSYIMEIDHKQKDTVYS